MSIEYRADFLSLTPSLQLLCGLGNFLNFLVPYFPNLENSKNNGYDLTGLL